MLGKGRGWNEINSFFSIQVFLVYLHEETNNTAQYLLTFKSVSKQASKRLLCHLMTSANVVNVVINRLIKAIIIESRWIATSGDIMNHSHAVIHQLELKPNVHFSPNLFGYICRSHIGMIITKT